MLENWIELIVGAWVMVSPWLLGFSSISVMKWSNLICGLVLILLNAWIIFEKPPERMDPSANIASKGRAKKPNF